MTDLTADQKLTCIQELIEDVHYHFHMYATRKASETEKATHLVELSNRVADLSTWHPSFDGRTGTLSWEREDDL